MKQYRKCVINNRNRKLFHNLNFLFILKYLKLPFEGGRGSIGKEVHCIYTCACNAFVFVQISKLNRFLQKYFPYNILTQI